MPNRKVKNKLIVNNLVFDTNYTVENNIILKFDHESIGAIPKNINPERHSKISFVQAPN